MTLHLNPGRFAPITCSPRVDSPCVVSPRKVSRFAPLNRYYIIIDEVFFDFGNYLFISCMQKNNNSFILVYFCQRSRAKLFLQITKNHTRTEKRLFFCTNAKVHEMTKMLYKCANNLSPCSVVCIVQRNFTHVIRCQTMKVNKEILHI